MCPTGWRTVGLLPILNASKAAKDTEAYREFKLFVYHECWRRLLLDVKQARNVGGVYVDVCGVRRLLVPEIAFFAQDSQEVRGIIIRCSAMRVDYSIFTLHITNILKYFLILRVIFANIAIHIHYIAYYCLHLTSLYLGRNALLSNT